MRKRNLLKIFLCLSLNLYSNEHECNLFPDYSNSRFENGRMILENLPDEMSGEKNGVWIEELLTIFHIKVSEADIQYGDHSISVKMPSCCCPKS
jgi:hypothetical protein